MEKLYNNRGCYQFCICVTAALSLHLFLADSIYQYMCLFPEGSIKEISRNYNLPRRSPKQMIAGSWWINTSDPLNLGETTLRYVYYTFPKILQILSPVTHRNGWHNTPFYWLLCLPCVLPYFSTGISCPSQIKKLQLNHCLLVRLKGTQIKTI